jgi:hypothetical protein
MRKNKKTEPEVFKKEELAVINKSMDFLYRNDKSITEKEKTALLSVFTKIRRIAKGGYFND